MIDYIVVGLGLAGISFCEVLEENNRNFLVFEDASQQSSSVAGGLYNPVILKRFTAVWKAKQQLNLIASFYEEIEKKLSVNLDYKVPVYRRFTSIEEQNMWFEASDKPVLNDFLSTKLIKNTNQYINAEFGYGEVLKTGRIDTAILQTAYRKYLVDLNKIRNESFNYDHIQFEKDHLIYEGIKAKNIVFAEGFGLKNNPFFNYLPLNGTKGELLTIKAPDLKIDYVLKSSVFIIPLGDDLYRVGATYKWKDKTNIPTDEAKEELLSKLNSFLKCDYELIDHVAGIRPTVADRRPLLGTHPQYNNIHVLNGFGSRGVMIAPYASKMLYNFIENNSLLEKEIDIKRFEKRYKSSISQ